MLLLTPGDDLERAQELQTATSAHLSELGAEVRLTETSELPDDDEAWSTVARHEIEAQGAISAFWWSAASSALYILTPELGESPAIKEFPDTGEGWTARCDAMAAAIQSELTPLLEATGPEPVPDAEDQPVESITDLVKPVEPKVDDTPQDETTLEIVGTAAYVPALMSTDGPLLSGANLGVGAVVMHTIEIGVSLDLMQPAELDVPGHDVDLVQWPARVTLSLYLPLDDWDVGLRFGGVFDSWKLRGLDYDPQDPEGAKRHLSVGMSTAFVARFRVLSWLAPWIEFGTDLHLTQLKHVYLGETLLTLAYYRPRGSIGVAFFFGVY